MCWTAKTDSSPRLIRSASSGRPAVPESIVFRTTTFARNAALYRKTDKKIVLYPGFCAIHDNLTVEEVGKARQRYPEAKVLVHPECRPEVIELADAALSTSQMLRYAKGSNAKDFLIGTEEGMLYPLRKQNPDKEFHLISSGLVCPDMKMTTLETVIETMRARKNIVTVPEEIRVRAKKAIDKMLAIS